MGGSLVGGAVPGTSCQATIAPSLPDISKQIVSNSSLDAQEICQALAGDSEQCLKI
jgi:hypothetical protein